MRANVSCAIRAEQTAGVKKPTDRLVQLRADARDPRIQAIRGRASGVARRRRTRRRDYMIRQARRRGLSYRKLGRRFGLSHERCRQICNRKWIVERPWITHPRPYPSEGRHRIGKRFGVSSEPGIAFRKRVLCRERMRRIRSQRARDARARGSPEPARSPNGGLTLPEDSFSMSALEAAWKDFDPFAAAEPRLEVQQIPDGTSDR